MKQHHVAQFLLAKYGDPRPQILHRSFRVSSSAGVFLDPVIPICPPNVSPVLPTTLTPPSFPTQAYLWLFLNSILKGCQTTLLTRPILFPNVLCAQGLCCLLLLLSRIKA